MDFCIFGGFFTNVLLIGVAYCEVFSWSISTEGVKSGNKVDALVLLLIITGHLNYTYPSNLFRVGRYKFLDGYLLFSAELASTSPPSTILYFY